MISGCNHYLHLRLYLANEKLYSQSIVTLQSQFIAIPNFCRCVSISSIMQRHNLLNIRKTLSEIVPRARPSTERDELVAISTRHDTRSKLSQTRCNVAFMEITRRSRTVRDCTFRDMRYAQQKLQAVSYLQWYVPILFQVLRAFKRYYCGWVCSDGAYRFLFRSWQCTHPLKR